MDKDRLPSWESEEGFRAWLVAEYLKYSSVDEVFRAHRYNIPISYPSFQRLLNEWGIVKAAGPNSKLSEVCAFLTEIAEEKLKDKKFSLEALYRRMPPSFRTSLGTMHRIYQKVKEGATRRFGAVLIISPGDNPEDLLVGNDVSTPRIELGKPYGAVSFPIGFARKSEENSQSIKRILQQEVFAHQTIERSFPEEVIPQNPQPFLYIDVADIKVSVYHLVLPKELKGPSDFSSFKIEKHRFVDISTILSENVKEGTFRAGMPEIAAFYQRYLYESEKSESVEPFVAKARLNLELAAVPLQAD